MKGEQKYSFFLLLFLTLPLVLLAYCRMQFCTTCKIPGFISFVAVVIHVYAVNKFRVGIHFFYSMFSSTLSLSVRLYIVIQSVSFFCPTSILFLVELCRHHAEYKQRDAACDECSVHLLCLHFIG